MNFRNRFCQLGTATFVALITCAPLFMTSAISAQAPTSAVGTASGTQTANVTITTPGIAASVSVVTQGSQTQDFAFVSGGNCAALTTYTAGQICTVAYTFTPGKPFTRYGAATVFDALGNVLGNAFLTGLGSGPQVSYPLGAASLSTAVGSGFAGPSGAVIDAAGDVYVADTQNNAVKQIQPGGNIVTVGSGFAFPTAVAIDGAGNVYVADSGNNAVKEILAVNGAVTGLSNVVTLGSGFTNPQGVAVDGSGNVYVADTTNGAVKEILAVNGVIPATPTINTLGSGFISPVSVAVDASGNVFVADTGKTAVIELVAVSGVVPASPTIAALGTGFASPSGIAVDGSGNVYVADMGNNAVKELLAVGGAVPTSSANVILLGSGYSNPKGVAVDGSGNVFVADSSNNAVKELSTQTVPSLTFSSSTAVGSTSTDSPMSFTVLNNGNAPLVLPVPATLSNPAASASYSVAGTCPLVSAGASAPGSLAAGASCTYAVSFVPVTAGSVPGSLTITDNNLNAAGATQSIPLNGTATQATLSVTVGSPSASVGSTSVTLTASVAYAGVAPVGTFTFTVNGGNAITASCTPGAASPLSCTAPYDASALNAGTYPIQGSIAADSNYGSASNSGTLTVTPGTPTLTLSTSGSPAAVDSTVMLTATVTPSNGIVPSNKVSFTTTLNGATTPILGCTAVTISSGKAICTTTALAAGANAINASLPGDSNFNSANATQITQTMTAAGTTLTTTSSQPGSATVDQAVTLTATLSSSAAFTLTPTGTVSFTSGGTVIPGCNAATVSATTHAATCTTSALVAPSDVIGATYTSGDTNFSGSTATSFTQVVAKGTPVNAIVANPTSGAVVNQAITFTASITPAGASTSGVTPAGSVTFTRGAGGANICAPVVVSAGGNGTGTAACTASFSTVLAGVGIFAVYSGDSNFTAGNSPSVSETVTAASTSTAVSSNSNPATVNSTVTLTPSVAPSNTGSGYPGTAIPQSGTLTISDSAATTNPICSSTLSGGVLSPANCSTIFTTSGNHVLTAAFTSTDSNFASSTTNSQLTEVVSTSSLTLTVSNPGPPSPIVNQSATFASTFPAFTAGQATPTGSVAYFDSLVGSTAICTVTVSGTGTIPNCTETLAAAGTHIITAIYTPSAGSSFQSTTSQNFVQVVAQSGTNTTITAPTVASTVDQQVTFTASIAPSSSGATLPTSNIVFTALISGNTTTLCTATLPVAGGTTASCTAPFTAAGAYSITAKYSGDSNFTGSTSTTRSQTVNQTNTSLNLVSGSTLSSPASPAVNQSAVYTVQLSLAGGINDANLTLPTGNVTFKDIAAASATCTVAVGATGQASCSFAELTAGSHNILITYNGDTNFGNSSVTLPETIAKSGSGIAAASISTNPSSPQVDQAGVVLNATVAPSNAGTAIPTGTVTFSDTLGASTSQACISTITAATGAVPPCSYVFTAPGVHTITAVYSGDTNFSGITATNTVTVGGAGGVTINVTSSSPSVTVNQQAAYTAAFSPVQTGPTYPAGSVQFFDGATLLPSCNTTVSATGTIPACTETLTSAGTHVISAVFTTANGSFSNITSGNLPQIVNQNSTKAVLTAPTAPSSVDQPVIFTASVTPSTLTPAAVGTTTPSGSVVFNYITNGVTTAICGGSLSTAGGVSTASCTAPFTVAGTYPVIAVYNGDANFTTNTSTSISQQVNKTSTAVGLVAGSTLASPSSPVANQLTPYTVQITPSLSDTGLTLPTGNVVFQDANVPSATCTAGLVASSGQASCSFTDSNTAAIVNGVHSIVATYTGDGNFSGSVQTFSITIGVASPTLSITAPTTNPTVNLAGFSFNATIALPSGSVGLPTGSVTFTDTVSNATCVSTVSGGVVAPCAFVFGTAGSHPIKAAYSGDSSFGPGSATTTITVSLAMPGMTLTSTPTVSAATQPVTFTATVTPSPAAKTGSPTGAITFSFPAAASVTPCTPVLSTLNGVESATCTVVFPYPVSGNFTVTANYAGDANYNAASATTAQTVQSFTPALTPATLTLGQGTSTNFTDPYVATTLTFVLAAQNLFADSTSTACTTSNTGLTCSLPIAPSLTSGPVPVNVTASSTIAPGVYTVTLTTTDLAHSTLVASLTTSVTVINRSYPAGQTGATLIPYAVPTLGQVTVPITIPTTLSGSAYSCASAVGNLTNSTTTPPTYSQTGNTLTSLGLACTVTGSGTSLNVTIIAGHSGAASLDRRPLANVNNVLAAGFIAPFLLIFGFSGRTRRIRKGMLRYMAIGLLGMAALYTTGCSNGFSTGAKNTTFAVGGQYLIGIANAQGTTVAEIPLLVTGNGSGI